MSSKSRRAAPLLILGVQHRHQNVFYPSCCPPLACVYHWQLQVCHYHGVRRNGCTVLYHHNQDGVGAGCCYDAGARGAMMGVQAMSRFLTGPVLTRPRHYMPPLCTPLIGHIRAPLMHYVIRAYYMPPLCNKLIGQIKPVKLHCGWR